MSEIIENALSQYGIREIKGRKDNSEVTKYFDIIGFDGEQLKDETAWCSAFANWVAIKSNRAYSGALNARSWLEVGSATKIPLIGDVVVLWRENIRSWKGHVGFFIKRDKTHVWIIGGNQNNEVNIRRYAIGRVLGYRVI